MMQEFRLPRKKGVFGERVRRWLHSSALSPTVMLTERISLRREAPVAWIYGKQEEWDDEQRKASQRKRVR
jgi:hypothetical protein